MGLAVGGDEGGGGEAGTTDCWEGEGILGLAPVSWLASSPAAVAALSRWSSSSWMIFLLSLADSSLASRGSLKGDFFAGLEDRLLSNLGTSGRSIDEDEVLTAPGLAALARGRLCLDSDPDSDPAPEVERISFLELQSEVLS